LLRSRSKGGLGQQGETEKKKEEFDHLNIEAGKDKREKLSREKNARMSDVMGRLYEKGKTVNSLSKKRRLTGCG